MQTEYLNTTCHWNDLRYRPRSIDNVTYKPWHAMSCFLLFIVNAKYDWICLVLIESMELILNLNMYDFVLIY